jgi:hypothetical protein
MLEGIRHEPAFWFSIFIPLAATIALALLVARNWGRSKEEHTYKADSFRGAINASLSVASLAIPLLCGALSYFYLNYSIEKGTISSLIAGLLFFVLTVLAGLWNISSLATVVRNDDTIIINQEINTYFPAQFVGQLLLLISGLVVTIVFFLGLGPKTRLPSVPASPANVYFIARTTIQVGMSETELYSLWGLPDNVRPSKQASEILCYYRTNRSNLTVAVRRGTIWSILEQHP